MRTPTPAVLRLDDPRAASPAVAGAKAANLATMAAAGLPVLPGFVVTTAGVAAGLDDAEVVAAVRARHRDLVADDGGPLVVRSSSTIEDATTSSMAGRFTSVLDVVGWEPFLAAASEVVASADAVRDDAGRAQPLAVLVQRQVDSPLGGVMFGVDPVTGARDHLVVEVVPSRPDVLVGGTAIADHVVLSHRGRVLDATCTGDCPPLPRRLRRALARMARRAERELGSPQDVEWCTDRTGAIWLLQTRPVTATAAHDAPGAVLLGPGPVAETFPRALRPLEEDIWATPLGEGLRRALRVSGAVPRRALDRSPVLVTVGGWAAVDLALTGIARQGTRRRTLNPVTATRRLLTAWRVGRLEVALPTMADAVVATVDRDLAAVPAPSELSLEELADLLERTGRELATVHSYEVLAGMLLDEAASATAAGAAMQALSDARAAGWDDATTIARVPVVLALCPPDLDGPRLPSGTATMAGPAPSSTRWDGANRSACAPAGSRSSARGSPARSGGGSPASGRSTTSGAWPSCASTSSSPWRAGAHHLPG